MKEKCMIVNVREETFQRWRQQFLFSHILFCNVTLPLFTHEMESMDLPPLHQGKPCDYLDQQNMAET